MGGGKVPQMTMTERLQIMKEEEAIARRQREEERQAKLEDDMLQASIKAAEDAKAASEAKIAKKQEMAMEEVNKKTLKSIQDKQKINALKIKKKNFDEDEY